MRAEKQLFTGITLVTSLLTPVAHAVEPTLTSAGFTGLGVTPNARLMGWGHAGLVYDNNLTGVALSPKGDNLVGVVGLLPNMEVSLRLAAATSRVDCFRSNCGARDLSAGGKAAIGLDAASRFHLAAGVADFGGGATYFRSYYGVLTYQEGTMEVSAGLAKRSGGERIRGSQSPLHGIFGSAAWQPTSWVRAHVEYSDREAWAGLRLFAPGQWLPDGWSAYVGTNHGLTDSPLTRRNWVTAGLTIPLFKTPNLPGQGAKTALAPLSGNQERLPAFEARAAAPAAPAPAAPVVTAPAATGGPATDQTLTDLAAALRQRGFEDIWVGRMPDQTVAIRANNATYNWNVADAVGVALGTVARNLAPTRSGYRLIVTQRQLPVVAVTGQADCLLQWIQSAEPTCTAGELSTPGTGPLEQLHEGASWIVQSEASSRRTLRASLSPILRTTVGTELATFDASVGLNVGLALPVWEGGTLEYRHNVLLESTRNFEPGTIFGNRRVRSGVERLALVQSWRLPFERWYPTTNPADVARLGLGAVTAQVSAGRFGLDYDGIHGAVRWEPGQGVHRFSAQAGWFRNQEFGNLRDQFGPRTPKPIIASYRYAVTPTRTYLEGSAGQYMNNDRGFQLGMRQWFTDVAVSAYYKRTTFSGAPARNLLGVEVSLPLGPRRDMQPGNWIQVTGTPRFGHGIETSVREGGGNPQRIGHAVLPPVPTLDATFNSDRSGLVYFEDNIRRIRDAAR